MARKSLPKDSETDGDDGLSQNELGYTIEGAARALERKYGLPYAALERSIMDATKAGELRVYDPQNGLPYTPKTRRVFWERVSVKELNAWLEEQRVPWRLRKYVKKKT